MCATASCSTVRVTPISTARVRVAIYGVTGAYTLASMLRCSSNSEAMEHRREYSAPTIEIIAMAVEHGFEASYGDYGEAGDSFDINDNGEF